MFCALLAWGGRAWAAPPGGGTRVALVIGNSSYRAVNALPNAANDARLMADTLRALGFTLVGGGAQLDLDRAGLARSVQEFGRSLPGAEVALFYYAGHGLQVQGVNWLVPVDANPSRAQDLDFQMVDADLVLRQMDGAGARLNVMLLDACRNNPFAGSGLRAMRGGLAEMRAPEGTLISYATQPGNVAVEGQGTNSPYTAALAGAMRQPGLDIFRMFNQVGLQVKRATGGAQQPWMSNSPIDGDFFFAGSATAVSPSAPGPAPPAPIPAPESARPSQPPSPVTASDPDSAAAVRALAKELGCSVLESRTAERQIVVTGLAGSGPAWDDFARRLIGTRGLRPVRFEVDLLPAFACSPLDVLGPAVRRARAQASGRMLVPSRQGVAAGGSLGITLAVPAASVIRLDLFRADGTVEHLPVNRLPQEGDALLLSVRMNRAAAPGLHVLAALVSPVSIPLGRRPATEPTDAYLAALRQALPAGDALLADMAPVTIRPAPAHSVERTAATPSATPPRPGRCATILERAQLGEALSDADRTALRTSCR